MEEKKKRSLFDRFWDFCARPTHRFARKHPEFYKKHRDIIGSAVCGFIGAAITYIVCSFMPYLFGQNMAEIELLLPDIDMELAGVTFDWSIIGFSIRWRDGMAIIGGGLGYSFSYYLANILSHLFTFVFMRKFHHSKLNPYKQYLIGLGFCFLTSIITNMINGLWLPIVNERLTFLEYNIIVLGIIGLVNFIVGHFQNIIIYKNDSMLNKRMMVMEENKNNSGNSTNIEAVEVAEADNTAITNDSNDEKEKDEV